MNPGFTIVILGKSNFSAFSSVNCAGGEDKGISLIGLLLGLFMKFFFFFLQDLAIKYFDK